jgi:hypothetical protein
MNLIHLFVYCCHLLNFFYEPHLKYHFHFLNLLCHKKKSIGEQI